MNKSTKKLTLNKETVKSLRVGSGIQTGGTVVLNGTFSQMNCPATAKCSIQKGQTTACTI